jgi:hypothetical protein
MEAEANASAGWCCENRLPTILRWRKKNFLHMLHQQREDYPTGSRLLSQGKDDKIYCCISATPAG